MSLVLTLLLPAGPVLPPLSTLSLNSQQELETFKDILIPGPTLSALASLSLEEEDSLEDLCILQQLLNPDP